MYERVENLRMTDIEASERYPNSYYAMRMDDRTGQMGTILFVGDDQSELLQLVLNLDDPTNCGVSEGLHLRRSLGGVVVGG
jgi:hypothetical protein